MIVDEAHNAVTGLTREMQAGVNPCAIVEFTATPRRRSNILHSVTAQELKREEMIKLPIMLSEHDTWQNAVSGAIAACASLAETASGDADYIRPLVLFQAQPRNQEVTVAALKDHLMEVEQIPEDKIAIATGNQRELDGIDLFDRACPIEYIITVEALKEGWTARLLMFFALCRAFKVQKMWSNFSVACFGCLMPNGAGLPISTRRMRFCPNRRLERRQKGLRISWWHGL